MKHRIALFVLVLLVPCVTLAQTPAPTPPAAPFREAVMPAPATHLMEEQQEMYPRQPTPQAAPRQPDLGKWWKDSDIVRVLRLTEQQITQIE